MIRFVDLFAGIGGIRLGFEQAMRDIGLRCECVLSSEIDSHAQETYPTKAEPGAWWEPSHRGGGAPTPEEAEVIDLTDYRRKVQA